MVLIKLSKPYSEFISSLDLVSAGLQIHLTPEQNNKGHRIVRSIRDTVSNGERIRYPVQKSDQYGIRYRKITSKRSAQ